MKEQGRYGEFSSPYSALGDDMDSQMAKSWAFEGHPMTLREKPSYYNDRSILNKAPVPLIVENPLTIPRSFTLFISPEKAQLPDNVITLPISEPATHHVYSAVGDD